MKSKPILGILGLCLGFFLFTAPPQEAAAYSYITVSSGGGNYFPSLIRLSPRFSTSWSSYANGDTHQDTRMSLEMGITPLNLVASRITCELSMSLDPFVMTSTTPGYTGFFSPGYTIQLAPALQFLPGKRNIVGLTGILGMGHREDFPAQPTLYFGSSKFLEYFSGGGGLAFTRFMGEKGDKGILSLRVYYTTLLKVSNTSYQVLKFQDLGTGLSAMQEVSVTLGYCFTI